jgi:hypothetical protein
MDINDRLTIGDKVRNYEMEGRAAATAGTEENTAENRESRGDVELIPLGQ